MGCRTTPLLRMQIASGTAIVGVPIPDDTLSLVIYNPSYATLLIRYGPTAADAHDPAGVDMRIPGPTLCELPLPAGATMLSVDWEVPPSGISGETVDVDTSGVDAIQIETKPTNPVTFIGTLNSMPVPLTGGM